MTDTEWQVNISLHLLESQRLLSDKGEFGEALLLILYSRILFDVPLSIKH